MKTTLTLFAAAIVAFATPAIADDDDIIPAASDEISKYQDVGPWAVYQNNTRSSCFATLVDEANGTALQMGLTKDHAAGYIGVFSKSIEVEGGSVNDIVLVINGNTYVGKSKAIASPLNEGYHGGYVLADKRMRLDLEKTNELVAFPDSPFVILVDMKRSGDAIYEARKCNEAFQ